MVLPVEYTKGLEFDAVLLLDPGREQYPTDDGHAKLLYVAATRALHRLCVLHTGNLTGLIADPVPKKNAVLRKQREEKRAQRADGGVQKPGTGKPEQPASVQRQLRKRISIVTNPAASHPAAGGIAPAPAQTARAKEPVRRPVSAAKPLSAPVQPQSTQGRLKAIPAKKPAGYGFGDMPDNGRLRPIGHSKPDFSIRWTEQRADGLYLQSRYGILRLCPVGSSIVRVTFSRRAQLPQEAHPGIAVNRTDRAWKYRENAKMVELMTPELCIQADKATGALRYLTKEKTLLMAEASKEPRLIESSVSGCQSRLFPEWDKKEKLYAAGGAGKPGIALEKTARYISHGGAEELPFLISEKGYGLLFATERPVIACTIPVYGQQLCLEDKDELDFYFIAGKRPDTLLNACAYLCGRL